MQGVYSHDRRVYIIIVHREEGTSKAQLSSRPLSSLDPSNLRNSPNFLGSTSSKGKKGELSTMSSALTTPDTEQGIPSKLSPS